MLKPGDKFERYTIEAPIGQGGMGQVYRAQDTRLGRRVALKVISERASGPAARERLMREARAAAALDHPNAVAIFDVGELEGAPFIVMELVPGRTLRASIEERAAGVGAGGAEGDAGGAARGDLAAPIAHLADAGRALGAAHRRGLVHRDVKPENVMVRDDGMVKVLDFGIARRTEGDVDPAGPTQTPALPTLTVEGIKLGTPVYMAPEQIKGDPLDGRADQFSWGVVAYELLSGRLPWRGSDALAAMASVLTDEVDTGPLDAAGVPRGVQDVVLRALEKRPERRFASMEEAVKALEAAARGEEPAPSPRRLVGPAVGAPGGAGAASGAAGAGAGATSEQRFSTGEVREVLAKAVERQAGKEGAAAKLTFEELLAVAAEVGVDADSLRDASRALRARGDGAAAGGRSPGSIEKGGESIEKAPRAGGGVRSPEDAARRDAWIRGRKRDFRRHAGIFVIVNAALLVLGLVLLTFTPWWVWFVPGVLWAIGLAIHGLVALTSDEDDWVEHERAVRWWEEGRRRRHEERMAWSEGRSRGRAATRPATPAPQERIQITPAADPRLRVGASGAIGDTEGAAAVAAAEEEAAAAAADARGRAKRKG